MKKLYLLSCLAMVSSPVQADTEIESFARQIINVFASGDTTAYMGILHPDCPAPNLDRLAWQMSSTWIADRAEIRIKEVSESYDRTKLEFKVEPEQVIAFQVWTKKENGEERELVTSYPVSTYEGEFKILDYPCFEPK